MIAGDDKSSSPELYTCLKAAFEESRVSFSRSSGPGGQNVNKTSTKATLTWRVAESGLEDRLREKLLRRLRVNKAGAVVFSSQSFRTQDLNLRQCRLKLREALERALMRRKPRIKTTVPAAQKRQRIKEKKVRTGIKRLRRAVDADS